MSERLNAMKVRMRRLKTLPVAPTLLTAGNLACGVTAVLCAAHDQLYWGAVLVFFAMICDMFDGKVARLTKQDGPFGAELDSLADVVSFGVAPAFLVHRLILGHSGVFNHGERLLWFITVFYVVMAAIRLARYNVEHSGPEPKPDDGKPLDQSFRGVPSPGAAAVICSLILFHQSRGQELFGSPARMENYVGLIDSLDWFRWLLFGVTVLCALLMVSTVRYPHAGAVLFGRLGFRKFIILFALGVLLWTWPATTLAVGTLGYLLFGLVAGTWQAIRAGRNPLDDDEDEDEAEDVGLGTDRLERPEGPAHGR